MTLGFVILGIGAVLVGLDQISNRVLTPAPHVPDRTVPETGVAHEDFSIRSGDHELAAFLLLPSSDARRPLLLLAHGWGASYATLLQLAEPLVADGYEVLLFDVRGHGRNPPTDYVTIRHFRDDVMAATRYARDRWADRPIVLIGHSLGGSAAVLATAEGSPADAAVLVAAPSDVMKVTAEFMSEKGMPGDLMVMLLRPFWWRRAGSLFGPLTPSRRIRELTIPLLMIQPEHDHRVARPHADRLAAASGQPYTLIEGAGHTDVLGREETHMAVRTFLESTFRTEAGEA